MLHNDVFQESDKTWAKSAPTSGKVKLDHLVRSCSKAPAFFPEVKSNRLPYDSNGYQELTRTEAIEAAFLLLKEEGHDVENHLALAKQATDVVYAKVAAAAGLSSFQAKEKAAEFHSDILDGIKAALSPEWVEKTQKLVPAAAIDAVHGKVGNRIRTADLGDGQFHHRNEKTRTAERDMIKALLTQSNNVIDRKCREAGEQLEDAYRNNQDYTACFSYQFTYTPNEAMRYFIKLAKPEVKAFKAQQPQKREY